MHALASHLGTTAATIERSMTALEFSQWMLYMERERIGPHWDRVRHAELMAAAHNGPCERRGGGAFTLRDFLIEDPWACAEAEKAPSNTGERARLEAEVMAMEGAFYG